MAVKIDLADRKIALGVGDLVAAPLVGVGRVAGLSIWARLEMGRDVHGQHQRAQTEQQAGYAREVFVRYTTTVTDPSSDSGPPFTVTIQGRIDGVQPGGPGQPAVIEEIKSVVASPLTFAALNVDSYPHYVEQLRLYCFLAEQTGAVSPAGRWEGPRPRGPLPGTEGAADRGDAVPPTAHGPADGGREPRWGNAPHGGPVPPTAPVVVGRLVFVNLADGARKDLEIGGPFTDCAALITQRVRALIGLATAEQQQRAERRRQADRLVFPHAAPRKFQDQMIAAVEQALASGRHLLVSAPSGIGKTAGALYPAVKRAYTHDQRVFFVTAKNTQHANAVETLRRMAVPSAVVFRAREKMCINSVYACREEFCPHLQDVAAKLERSGVTERLLGQRLITPEGLIEAGQGARLCPFDLALLAAERTDVIVCDYNYVFDPQVYFRRFFQDNDYSDAILIIDEAHNLVGRALEYYSPRLRRRALAELAASLRRIEPALAREFRKVLGLLNELFERLRPGLADEYSQADTGPVGDGEKFLIESPRDYFADLKPVVNRLAVRYMLDKIGSGRAVAEDPVEQFFADFGQFAAVLNMAGEEFSYIFDTTDGEALQILCKDPARQLARRLEGFHSVIAMSATLAPLSFYQQMLGFDPERTDTVSLPSPFPRENRKILVVPRVLTTFRQRAAHYGEIAEIIVTTAAARRGNYLALFPSYDFLRAVAAKLTADGDSTDWELKVQETAMSETAREELLASLRVADQPKLVLAVQGGVFAEGVDYPGEVLSGVIVVSPALPQLSFERELMRQYYEQRYSKGFEYAYIYPGMNRVIQSVGRLIRGETDCGVAVLVCQRFNQPAYTALFPGDWREDGRETLVCKDLETELRHFWERIVQRAGD